MKLVIDIPEGFYEEVRKDTSVLAPPFLSCEKVGKIIANGTPLPKGHGDLIDKVKFKRWIETQDGDKLMTEYYLDALDMQETVVGGSYDGDID